MKLVHHALGLALRPLEMPTSAPRAADAIVVLGAPLAADGGLTPVLAERVRASVDLYRRGHAQRIIMTGGGFGAVAEAAPMRTHAIELGVPGHAVESEELSRTTVENAQFTRRLFGTDDPTVWLVSQPFHLRRAVRVFRESGFVALPYRMPDSVQDRDPKTALKWGAREYAAWLYHFGRAGITAIKLR